MSASRPGNMRGPWVKTPLLVLLLLLAGVARTETQTQDEDTSDSEGLEVDAQPSASPSSVSSSTLTPYTTHTEVPDFLETTDDPSDTNLTTLSSEPNEGLSFIIILIPVVLVVITIAIIVCGIFISRWVTQQSRNEALREEDPYLDGSSTEKVPMPMFEEDVPSVLEVEMEELDQWMKKDGGITEDSNHE
ncbi:transmembrane protein 154 isoform X2 [Mastacembelus armatus]|uniref:Transmembrane protein 154 n=1 Tax=Mastacembelus armatus TaxID=205130 RepID=A0A7N8XB83_9TELE|nr:transmembrane protein 154 isoform X2 [Mastacembelus armatus]